MRKLLFLLLVLLIGTSAIATNYFISPVGDDSQSGLTADMALASISRGFTLALPGDTLFLLPGQYSGTATIRNRRGEPDTPIVLKSLATDPLEFAIIDGGSLPTQHVARHGLHFINCGWIEVENIVFRNCWRNVISLERSAYMTVRSCHFTSGKEVVFPTGNDAHHILVEHCYVQHPAEVWRGWSWEAIHHGEHEHYNGALLHPHASGGGHVMRSNTLINLFNGFRTKPDNIRQDGNIEIYDNTLLNIRDNDFEPEEWAWNVHYHANHHRNIHKAYSIDDVRGGHLYLYSNTYTQDDDSYTRSEVSAIFKYKDGPLTYPCYAFNNSYYTEARVLKDEESTNHLLKHYNNAYYFFRGSERFQVDAWQPGFEFDFDLINQSFPAVIDDNQQEQNGLENTDARFRDGSDVDFRLAPNSPATDEGTIMSFPESGWTQR
jgi:hypothetical protein